jgi:hypothetical protein
MSLKKAEKLKKMAKRKGYEHWYDQPRTRGQRNPKYVVSQHHTDVQMLEGRNENDIGHRAASRSGHKLRKTHKKEEE